MPTFPTSPTWPAGPAYKAAPTFPGGGGFTSDASVVVDRATPNAIRATSLTAIGPWMTSTRFAGWRDNFSGSGLARHSGSIPVYEGDGTSDQQGLSVTQALSRYAEVAGKVYLNLCAYNSAIGNCWPLPTADCPASNTTTYPLYAHYFGGSPPAGAIPFVDGDGYFAPPAGVTASSPPDSLNPWATADLKMAQARTITSKANIVGIMRACPAQFGASWNGSSTSGGATNGSQASDPNKANGNPPLWMNVLASGTPGSSVGFGGWLSASRTAGQSTGTIVAAGAGQWALTNSPAPLVVGEVITFEPGTVREETKTLSSLNTSTGAFTISGTFAFNHGANTLVVQNCGTRVISGFWGGNAATSGQAATGYAPAVGRQWTFFHLFARLMRRYAERYPYIQTWFSWGEPGNSGAAAVTSTTDTGAWGQTSNVWWDDDGSGHNLQASPAWAPGGRNGLVPATILYNLCWDALKNIPGRNYTTSPLSIGGPYHSVGAPTGGALQANDLSAMTVFFNNAVGLDFVVCDGFNYGNTFTTAPAAGPSTVLSKIAGGTNGLQAAFALFRTFLATFPITSGLDTHWAETYVDSNLAHMDYSNPSVGPATSNWFTSECQAMALTSMLYAFILSGVASVGRWQASGDTAATFHGYVDAAFGNTNNMQSLVSTSKNSDAATTGLTSVVLGKPFPAHAAFKLIKDNFGPGAALKTTTVVDDSASAGQTILALDNGSVTLIISQHNVAKIISLTVGAAAPVAVSVPAYGVVAV